MADRINPNDTKILRELEGIYSVLSDIKEILFRIEHKK